MEGIRSRRASKLCSFRLHCDKRERIEEVRGGVERNTFAGGRSTVPDTRPAARGEGPEPEVEKRRRRPSPGGEVARQEEEQKARKDGGPWPCTSTLQEGLLGSSVGIPLFYY